jgi:integrase
MAVYSRGEQCWIDFYYAGKRYRRPAGTNGKEARKALDRIKGDIASGDFDPADLDPQPEELGVLFEKALDLYIEHREAQGKQRASYLYLDRLWREVLKGRPVREITSEEIEMHLSTWGEDRDWAPATRNSTLMQLSGFLSYCYGRRWIESHPTEKGRVPLLAVDNCRERWLTLAEIETLIEKAPEYMKPMIRFACCTAMRLGEICTLTRASYQKAEDGKPYLVTERTKNGERLVWPLEGWAKEYVEARVDDLPFPGSHLFAGPDGEAAREGILRGFQAVVEAAGFEYGRTRQGITFHSLRRTAATLALNAGVPEHVVQKLGNWKDRGMVALYARVSDVTLRDAAGKLAGLIGGSHKVVTIDREAREAGAARIGASA